MGTTSFFNRLPISASGKIVPAPVPFPPVPMMTMTECPRIAASTSSRDSSNA
jgi:hypothetical protein